ncbi:uncharacterized protein LOC117315463 [Pecten maximus]|uniref:uncharacterized protein LOC117315463 n=1 Tax=Pecten maximus TaxID=6579 RepID=UPI001458541F|nr:uncharacterized protein LOC117315463 [Pecten maximus]
MSNYSSLTLPELRSKLRERNAKTSGRKKELIERLESYDRNDNFGRTDEHTNADYNMTLPAITQYSDLNSDRNLAPINSDKIAFCLRNFDKTMDKHAKGLYQEKYLCYLRLCSTVTHDFLRSSCRAEMRKSVTYLVDVSLSKDGHIFESQCECAAGMGPNVHCKHVCAVLYACSEFCVKKCVLTEQTCTEKLQTFHQTPKYKGSPVKARDAILEGSDILSGTSFDPRPQQFRGSEGYNDYFRNICLNFSGASEMPISQLFEPANSKGVAHDHDYLLETPEDRFLSSLNVSAIDNKERNKIEITTRGQSTNEVWKSERLKRIQSSNFGRICKATDRTDFVKLANSLLCFKRLKTEAIVHGQKFEHEAKVRYEKECAVSVKDCGIFVCKEHPFLGASPDGVVDENLIVEIKCPYSSKNRIISEVTVPYLKIVNGNLVLDSKHDYYHQVQGQLLCSQRSLCDFVVYTLSDMKVLRIKRDEEFISRMVAKLTSFYNQYLEPALLEKLFYRPL